jgi:hypothetical protein
MLCFSESVSINIQGHKMPILNIGDGVYWRMPLIEKLSRIGTIINTKEDNNRGIMYLVQWSDETYNWYDEYTIESLRKEFLKEIDDGAEVI